MGAIYVHIGSQIATTFIRNSKQAGIILGELFIEPQEACAQIRAGPMHLMSFDPGHRIQQRGVVSNS